MRLVPTNTLQVLPAFAQYTGYLPVRAIVCATWTFQLFMVLFSMQDGKYHISDFHLVKYDRGGTLIHHRTLSRTLSK